MTFRWFLSLDLDDRVYQQQIKIELVPSATDMVITGPATKITNLGALKIVFGMKRFLLYLAFTIAFAFGTGLVFDLIIAE